MSREKIESIKKRIELSNEEKQIVALKLKRKYGNRKMTPEEAIKIIEDMEDKLLELKAKKLKKTKEDAKKKKKELKKRNRAKKINRK